MGRVRVASFNIRTSTGRDGRDRWLWRRRACLEAIAALDADVVGLQEVRPRQLRAVRRAFGDHAVLGRGREAAGGGEHATILVRSGWTVESSETRWLSPTPQQPGSRGWGATQPRVVTLARLRRGDERLGVANTHLDHRRDDRAREQSALLLARWLGEETDRPWVLVGDLNAEPDSRAVRTLREAGLVDGLEGVAGGTFHGFTGATDRERIDYVMIGPGIGVLDARIVTDRRRGRLPSDHWPILADLEIPAHR